MANPEHLKILMQGVEAWNRWRKKNPMVKPDLTGADLHERNLSGVNLSEANLSDARLYNARLAEANLSEADLSYAVLKYVDLSKAKLSRAYLYDADLSDADLSGADFSRSNFSGADISRSDLPGADFSYSYFGITLIGGVDLRGAKGLELVKHGAPSHIDISTIVKSEGNIPESFLRGCGVPDNFIQYMSSLTGKAFDFYSCFISYSSKNQDFAERLHADLQNKGVRCWFAPEDMKIGDKIRDRIDQSIRLHDKLLLILSEHSINSEWVEEEVDAAYEQERRRGKAVLFPIRLDDAVMKTDEAWNDIH